jgi:predicted dehydrogenase
LRAIHQNQNIWPTFEEGMEVNRVVKAALDSHDKRAWVDVKDY